MENSKSVSTPLDINQKVSKELCPKSEENGPHYPYQEAIGSIMYAAQVTRPDVAFAGGLISKLNNNAAQYTAS